MKTSGQVQTGKPALELVEEAFHLLRTAPRGALFSYLAGSLPFVLGLLYFWSDMSRGAYADQRLAASAVGMTLLFGWMKLWQAVFVRQLLAQLCREAPPRWTVLGLFQTAFLQAILQPSGLFLLPISLVAMLPFGWAYAFYQNVTFFSTGEAPSLKSVFQKSWAQARLWPLQNHALLLVFQGFALFVLLNLAVAILTLPFLLKMLLGVETIFSQSWSAGLNTTFLATVVSLTYLCVDPFLKAVYVLRCFYGESIRTGRDLQADLKNLAPSSALALLTLFCLISAVPTASAAAEEARTKAPARSLQNTTLAPADLDRSIEEVMRRREFTWRMPRVKAERENRAGTFQAFVDGIVESLEKALATVGRWIGDLIKWFSRLRNPSLQEGSGSSWLGAMRGMLLLLCALLAGILAALLYRLWKRRSSPASPEVSALALLPAPDLADGTVGADQLPEEGWLSLARELFSKGEPRLALRAFYLASLSHLARRNLITLARFKSNLDYERELGRRAHALPEITDLFTQNVAIFDRAWYGRHEVHPEILEEFAQNVRKIQASA